MGGKNTKANIQNHLSENWIIANHNLPLDQIYKHTQSGILGQKSIIKIDPKYAIEQQLNIYQWRKNNNSSLVQTYDAEEFQFQKIGKDKSNLELCGKTHNLIVISQPIVKRYSQLPQLTFPQTLYALRQSLKAYEQVYKRIGAIHVNDDIIGLNRFGQIKCWVNPNWGENHPKQSMQRNILISTTYIPIKKLSSNSNNNNLSYQMIQPKYRDQFQMTKNIIDVIQGKCQQGKFPKQFSDYMFINGIGFKQAKKFIAQFIVKNKIKIPSKILQNKIFICTSKQKYLNNEFHQQYNNNHEFSTLKNDKLNSSNYFSFNPQYYQNQNKKNNILLKAPNSLNNAQFTQSINTKNIKHYQQSTNASSVVNKDNQINLYNLSIENNNRSSGLSNLYSYKQSKKYQQPSNKYSYHNNRSLNNNQSNTAFNISNFNMNNINNSVSNNKNINKSSLLNEKLSIDQSLNKNNSKNLNINFEKSNYHKNITFV